jgi:CrcB protein
MAGAVGTGARYLLGLWSVATFGPVLPVATFTVNVVGSFFMSFVMQTSLTTDLIPPSLRAIITTGFMGGLTTYSAFNYETVSFFRGSMGWAAVLYVVTTLGACGLSGLLGVVAARYMVGAR